MNLKSWNRLAFFTHAAITIALIVYFIVKKGGINFNTDLYTFHIKLNENDPGNSELTAEKTLSVSGTALKVLVVVYFAFTAFFHLLYMTDGFGSGSYTRAVNAQNNYFRWIEYGISSTIMTFLIAIICGVKGFDTVILLILMNIGMIICGQIAEVATANGLKQVAILATAVGWVLILGIIFAFFYCFFVALNDGKVNNFDIPWWVYTIIFPLVIWYASFGVVSLIQNFFMKHTVANYVKIEKAYILLSFISKINLGIFIAFGLTRPKDEKVD